MSHAGRHADPKPARRPSRASCALVGLVLASCGCRLTRPDTRYDLLEAELRARDARIDQLQAELGRARQFDLAFAPRVGAGQGDPLADPNCPPGAPGVGVPTLPLKDIALAAGTGGVDEDGSPGDEYLNVTIAPRDEDGTVVKVPLSAVVQAYELSAAGLKTPIGRWDVSPSEMRRAWKSGLLGSGYSVPLRWDRPPTSDRLRVVARATTADGREFEAEKEVRVKPLPGSPGRPPEAKPAVPGPAIGPPRNELPPPGTTLPPRPGRVPVAGPPAGPPAGPLGGREELPPPARLRHRG